jgi:hypothetical protein
MLVFSFIAYGHEQMYFARPKAHITHDNLRIVHSCFLKPGQQCYIDFIRSALPMSLCISTIAAVFKRLFNFCCIF